MPWFHFSFDMLILKSPRSSNHLRLINLSICIHTCDLSYPGATLPVLIAHLQGSTLCDCTGSERLGGSPVACKVALPTGQRKRRRSELLSRADPGTEPEVLVCTFRGSKVVLLSPVTARSSLRGCLLSLKAGERQWIIICARRCC